MKLGREGGLTLLTREAKSAERTNQRAALIRNPDGTRPFPDAPMPAVHSGSARKEIRSFSAIAMSNSKRLPPGTAGAAGAALAEQGSWMVGPAGLEPATNGL